MLILTRKIHQAIIINADIKVSVLGIHNRQIRIGVEAPKAVEVHREEIYQKIQREKNIKEES